MNFYISNSVPDGYHVFWTQEILRPLEICIRRLIGASIKDIVVLILGKYIIIAFISFAIGFLYCNIFYPAYFNFLVKGYAACALFIVFFILWSIWILLREPIEEAIK